MIIVRPFAAHDQPAIDAMHQAMGFDYQPPDWACWNPGPQWSAQGKTLVQNGQFAGYADTEELAKEIAQAMNERRPISAIIEVDGQPESAAFLRKTAECYWVMNPFFGRRRDRLAHLLMMHRELLIPAQRAGFTDIHAWPPPQIADHFGKLLMHLGWKKPLWPCFSREVK